MENGFFGKLFDLDNSNDLDTGEQFLDFMTFTEVMKGDIAELSDEEE